MPFFLIGKNADDELSLLTPAVIESRQAALAELSRITGDASFDQWDSEVFVVDLDKGIPVLLVRPGGESEPEADASVPEEPEAELDASEEASLETDEAEVVAILEEEVVEVVEVTPEDEEILEVEEPETFAVDAEEPVAETEDAVVVEEAEVVVETEPDLTDAEILIAVEVDDAEAFVAEEPEDVVEEAAEETGEADGLRDALLRTTEQMEASGIVAPESVGPAVVEESETETVIEEPVEPMGISEEEPGEPAAQVWPWDNAEETGADVPVPPVDVAFVLDALEEPGADDTSLLRSSVDDETFAAAKPVILGAYDEPVAAAEPMSIDETEIVPDTLGETPAFSGDSAPATDDLSDFILDLETVTSVPEAGAVEAAPIAAEPAVDASPMSEYTCGDCVYEETCPNRDQRLPKDCVSFQWK